MSDNFSAFSANLVLNSETNTNISTIDTKKQSSPIRYSLWKATNVVTYINWLI